MTGHKIEQRCRRSGDDLELCAAEAEPRLAAFASMVASGDYDNAEAMAANIARIVATHLAERELRGRR